VKSNRPGRVRWGVLQPVSTGLDEWVPIIPNQTGKHTENNPNPDICYKTCMLIGRLPWISRGCQLLQR